MDPETGSLLARRGEDAPEACMIGMPGPLLFDRACPGLEVAPE